MEYRTKKELISIAEKFTSQNIMVVGDLMLDQYTWGSVERISPEAPIPVLKVLREENRLGGAASTVANVRALGCQVFPVGVIGSDHNGKKMIDLFDEKEISTQGLLILPHYQTILKNRLLTTQQQLLRTDYEQAFSHTEETIKLLQAKVEELLPLVEGVIISDYQKGLLNKGILQQIIQGARKREIPVICDPGRGVDVSWYQGVTTIKPNRLETKSVTGIELDSQESILLAAKSLQEECKADFLSISLDKDGILYYQGENDFQFFHTEAKEVFDVTGAGDIVVSIIGVLLASGVTPQSAIQMANLAARLEISQMGVAPIPWSQILDELRENTLSQKILSLEKLEEELGKNPEIPVVFTNGFFDNLSAGHINFLLGMSQFSGNIIVAINSDRSILKSKGKLPLLSEIDRARLLASLENVTWVVIFEDDHASELIRRLRPQIVTKGEKFKGVELPEQEAIEEIGAKVEYLDHSHWSG